MKIQNQSVDQACHKIQSSMKDRFGFSVGYDLYWDVWKQIGPTDPVHGGANRARLICIALSLMASKIMRYSQ